MEPQPNNLRPRTKLLAVIMLAAFVVSVAAAWWISTHRQSYLRSGEETMTQIRQSGLKSFYGRGSQQYFIIRNKGANVGWRVFECKPAANGYKGLIAQPDSAGGKKMISWESWQLSNDLNEGKYNALEPAHKLPGALQRTQILLDQGRVEVTQAYFTPNGLEIENLTQTSAALVPNNYLAEGSLPLAIQKVAQNHSSAYFKIVMNQVDPMHTSSGMETRLSTASIEYVGQESVTVGPQTVQASVASLTRSGFGREETEKYYFGPDWKLIMIASGDIVAVSVTKPELDSAYPEAYNQFADLARRKEVGYGGTFIEPATLDSIGHMLGF